MIDAGASGSIQPDIASRALILPAKAHPLTALGGCAYSPAFADADTVVFDLSANDAVDLWVVDLGGEPRVVRSDPVAWEWRASPGARPGEIVYLETIMDDDSRSAIVQLDVASGREVGRFTAATSGVAFARGAVLYAGDAGSQIRRREGDRDEVAAAMPPEILVQQVIASAGGDRLAILTARNVSGTRVCTVSGDGGDVRCLDERIAGGRPAFSTHGDALFVDTADGVVRVALDGSGERRVVIPGVVAEGGIAVGPDGANLVWSTCTSHSQVVRFAEDAATASEVLVADPNVRAPVLGPEGRLAWIQRRDAGEVVFVRDAGGAIVQVAGPELGSLNRVAFAPDGDTVAFESTVGAGGIYVADVRAVKRPRLVIDGGERPVWIDAGRLAITRYDDGNVPQGWIVDVDDGESRRLLAGRIPLARNSETGHVLLVRGEQLAWWDPATGREHPGPSHGGIRGDLYHASIAPGAGWLLIQTGVIGQLFWRARLPGGAPELLFELPGDQTVGPATIDDDGRVVAAPQAWRGELFIAPAAPGVTL